MNGAERDGDTAEHGFDFRPHDMGARESARLRPDRAHPRRRSPARRARPQAGRPPHQHPAPARPARRCPRRRNATAAAPAAAGKHLHQASATPATDHVAAASILFAAARGSARGRGRRRAGAGACCRPTRWRPRSHDRQKRVEKTRIAAPSSARLEPSTVASAAQIAERGRAPEPIRSYRRPAPARPACRIPGTPCARACRATGSRRPAGR